MSDSQEDPWAWMTPEAAERLSKPLTLKARPSMETAKDILDEKEFCKLHSDYHGEQIDSLAHLAQQTFTGEELFEFVKFCIMQKGPEIAEKAWEAGFQRGAHEFRDLLKCKHPDKSTFMKSLFPLKEI